MPLRDDLQNAVSNSASSTVACFPSLNSCRTRCALTGTEPTSLKQLATSSGCRSRISTQKTLIAVVENVVRHLQRECAVPVSTRYHIRISTVQMLLIGTQRHATMELCGRRLKRVSESSQNVFVCEHQSGWHAFPITTTCGSAESDLKSSDKVTSCILPQTSPFSKCQRQFLSN